MMQSAQQLTEHYRSVRARLYSPPNAVKPRLIVVVPATPEPPEVVTPAHVDIDRDWLLIATDIPRVFWKRVVLDIASSHRLTIAQIFSDQRSKHIVKARHESFYRLHRELGMSLAQIGRHFRMDHTSVLHGVRQHEKRMAIR